MPEPGSKSVSIIIPVYNEASQLDRNLKNLFDCLKNNSEIEVILSDGGSTDNSLEIARRYPCKICHSETGRARQMNAGCRHAKGDFLLFLHADSTLPDDWPEQVKAAQHWGFFPIRLSGRHWLLRVIERAVNLRSRLTRVATGDQCLYFRRCFFHDLRGFPEISLMEDVAISKAARKLSKPRIGLHAVTTSSRRWEQNGMVKTIVLMWGLRLAWFLGVSPDRLHRFYRQG